MKFSQSGSRGLMSISPPSHTNASIKRQITLIDFHNGTCPDCSKSNGKLLDVQFPKINHKVVARRQRKHFKSSHPYIRTIGVGEDPRNLMVWPLPFSKKKQSTERTNLGNAVTDTACPEMDRQPKGNEAPGDFCSTGSVGWTSPSECANQPQLLLAVIGILDTFSGLPLLYE